MDRAKAGVYLVGVFGVATLIQGAGLASMAGFEPQLSLFFGGGLLLSGVAARTLHEQRYEEFALFRRRDLVFWAACVALGIYIATVVLQLL